MTSKKETAIRREEALQALGQALGDEFAISAVADYGDEVVARIEERLFALPYGPNRDRVAQALKEHHCKVEWLENASGLHVRLKFHTAKTFPRTNLTLFLLTLVSVFFVPQCHHAMEVAALNGATSFDPFAWFVTPSQWEVSWALQFTGWLMAILLAHEFGHYFAGRRRNLNVSLPYFIPFPTLIGTMGAVIRFRSPIENRRDLIEVGAAGPVAGFIVALVAAYIGILQTDIQQPGLSFSFAGESLIMSYLGWLIHGEALAGQYIQLAPAAYAGWVGFLVTALNMLPISQLDGGHITYGLFGAKQRIVALVTLGGLGIAGMYWSGWWVYAAFALFFRPFHPPTLDDSAPIPTGAKILGWTALVIFVLTFALAPFGLDTGGVDSSQ
ncbi:site-2 protease family protein [Gemmatimonas aurantiaca]|nr:site-2 protease family protein [Gemmatimonas aurantiaca]